MQKITFYLLSVLVLCISLSSCKKAEESISSVIGSTLTFSLDGTAQSASLVLYNTNTSVNVVSGVLPNGYLLNVSIPADTGTFTLGLTSFNTLVYSKSDGTDLYTTNGSLTGGKLVISENNSSKIKGTFNGTLAGLNGSKVITNGAFTYIKK